jgi:hypothetical protein
MDTSAFAALFQETGPFATVLVDVAHDTENGEHEHELRVRAAADQLLEQGCEPDVVALTSARLSELVPRPAPVCRLVVANAAGVQYDDLASARVDQTVAHWGPLPELAAWIQLRDSALTFVLALVDHTGGDVAVFDSAVPEPQDEVHLVGETHHVHKVPVGGWSALRYQHVTENVWAKNAEAVVEQVVSHVRAGHHLVLLGGDPTSVGLVRDALDEVGAKVIELESGTRAEDGGDEALQHAIRQSLMGEVVSRRVALVHELKDRLGRNYAVAVGTRDVADAFVRGQVDTLLLDPDAASEVTLDIKDHPGLVLGPTPIDGPVRADQALIAAAVLTDAKVVVSPSAALGGSPVAALLRWDQHETPPG